MLVMIERTTQRATREKKTALLTGRYRCQEPLQNATKVQADQYFILFIHGHELHIISVHNMKQCAKFSQYKQPHSAVEAVMSLEIR